MEKENKIDKAIDEILESKRLREGANVIKKTFKVVIILGVVFFYSFNDSCCFRYS